MRLTAKEHPEAIKRYGHIKPRGWRGQPCSTLCPGTAHLCTRAKGHRGPHVAHGWFRKVLAVWEPDTRGAESPQLVPRQSSTRPGKGLTARRPVGLQSKSPVGILEGLRKLIGHAIASAEELAFMIFFLAFVAFAIGGFLLIYLG